MIWEIRPNNNPELKEKCWLCSGKGFVEEIQSECDGEAWHVFGEVTAICPKCCGSKELVKDFVMEQTK